MSQSSASLGRFLPQFLRERYAEGVELASGYEEWPVHGALLFVDVVGFTGRVERLVTRGPDGVELANELIENSIGQLIAELVAEGGDVVVFGGDGLFVLWQTASTGTGLSSAINRAAAAALQALDNRAADKISDAPSLRFSLGAGSFVAHRVGGHNDRWHCLLSGPAFEQVGRADALAQNNALIASPEAFSLAEGRISVSRSKDGMLRVHSCSSVDTPSPIFFSAQNSCSREFALPHICEPIHQNLARLDSLWLEEFRRPSVIFARLPGLLSEGHLDGASAHRAARAIQGIVSRHDGNILQFVVDDKGPVFVIAFGLSAKVHEDDAARAALAALDMVQLLSSMNLQCGIGVATGRVFCGLIGDHARCDYTLIGHTMNFAARLMQKASPGPLVDQLTRDLGRQRVEFVLEGLMDVKGIDAAVTHYRASGRRNATLNDDARSAGRTPLVGRDAEMDVLRNQLNSLVSQRRGGLIAIIGEAGIGKSCLVHEIMQRAKAMSVITATAAAPAGESSPQNRWTPVVRTLLTQQHSQTEAANETARSDPYLQAFIGQLPDELALIDDAERALRTRKAISQLVSQCAKHTPILLCVEDTHWMDSLSWSFLVRLAQDAVSEQSGLLIVLTTRELESSAPEHLLKKLSALGMQYLPLGPVPEVDRASIARSVIGVSSLSDRASQWIARSSGGNPLFCRELASAAMDNGSLEVMNDCADLSESEVRNQAMTQLPDTLIGLIASRLDRLDPQQQIGLRVAAVIGVSITVPALLALHPDAAPEVESQLAQLCALGFLHPASSEQHGDFVFHHALIRDAAYESLPYRRRRELHGRYAQWMELQTVAPVRQRAADLAHHWEQAENWQRSYECRLDAGDIALTNFANREAVQHFSTARVVRSRNPALRDHLRRWDAELGLAQALHRIGDERASRRHIEETLRSSGEFIPTTVTGRLWALTQEALMRLTGMKVRLPRRLRNANRLRMTVKAYDLLPDILYYDNDPLSLAYIAMRYERLSAAERRPSPEQARALGWYALLQSSLGRIKSSEIGLDHAMSVAELAEQPAINAWLRLARGSLLAQNGKWQESERWLGDALQRYESMGDRTRVWNVMSGLAHVLAFSGRIAAAREVLRVALERNVDTDNPVFTAWGSAGLACMMQRLGEADHDNGALQLLRKARDALASRPDAAADLFSRGLLAAALHRSDQHDEAFDLVRETVEIAISKAPLVWLQQSSFLSLEEVLQAASEDPARKDSALRLLAATRKILRSYARRIPIGAPVLMLVSARIEIVCGRPARARKYLRQGLESAGRMGLVFESGKIYAAMAETLEPELGLRELEKAQAIFQRIGAQYEVMKIQRRLFAASGAPNSS